MRNTSWFSVTAAASGKVPEIFIYDYIGAYGVTAKDFSDELKALKSADFDLHINSPGGEVFVGNAIYNMLERHTGKITVYVDGLAASMASLIAMVGDEIIMPANAMMMIHNPAGGVLGGASEMRQWADTLDKLKQGMVSAYSKKSGLPAEEISSLMDDETWMTAQEAVDKGFATILEEPVAIAATFDLSKYVHPPAALLTGFTDQPTESLDMTTKTETAAEMEARLRTELTASITAAIKPATTEVTETAAEVEARVRAAVASEQATKDARAADIRAACALKNLPTAKVEEFVASTKTIGQVIAELATATPTAGAELNAHLGAGGKEQGEGATVYALDEADVYARYNRTGKYARRA